MAIGPSICSCRFLDKQRKTARVFRARTGGLSATLNMQRPFSSIQPHAFVKESGLKKQAQFRLIGPIRSSVHLTCVFCIVEVGRVASEAGTNE